MARTTVDSCEVGRNISSRKHLFASMAHRLRDVAKLNQLKLIYHLREELDLSDSRDVQSRGLTLSDCVPPIPKL
ncbi:hypothetical protein B0H14DRAFT_2379645 [Mycena olivaceomarginata]|nr:hypothetical protein B0H14DRAFT_2379645 [Mycena olivaceomarginata]